MTTLIERISQTLSILLFKGFLWFQSRPSIVKQVLAEKHITPSSAVDELPESGRPSKIRVAAVQMKLELIKENHALAYAETVYRLTKEAVEQGAQLVVFPEYSGIPLVGLIPGLEDLAREGLDSAVKQVSGGETKVADVFRLLSPAVKRIYETTFSTLARSFRVYIISGSTLLEDDDGKMRNIGYFFDPSGNLIARQRKLHLVPLEAEWGFESGRELEVLDTRLGRIAFPICMDATYFETFRIARLRGADVVVIPAANNEEYLFWRTMRGIWPRVQESQVLGVSAHAVGNLIGIPFTGRSGLLGPLELTQSGNGYFTQADTFNDEEVVVGDLNLDALYQFREESPLNFNVTLYEKYLPGLYKEGQKERTQNTGCLKE
jgi:predicted amidohydrolase